MNTKKEAASPLLSTQPIPSGPGVCRAMLRGRPSSLKDADASLRDRPAGRSLTPETSTAPGAVGAGRPGPARAGGAAHRSPLTAKIKRLKIT